ncbi:HD domain-containing protein [Aureimonas sp. D3]|uniref:HD domain-containing protein n=1 Tax=Aureimonas sp. D3 TaxID=1638164 RepID=UPI0009E7D1A3|nr:HD domain-containing protein [Aureimonas sp. D3]
MAESRNQRIRDPIHGLIVFKSRSAIDQLAWRLIGTSEFQRLRRIHQLGVSEFTFPGAVHTRFAHSIGVFFCARLLVDVIERELTNSGKTFSIPKSEVAVIAALLHDLGHGPFSHTFESVQEARGVKKRHESWTAEIIQNPKGEIRGLLDGYRIGFCKEVAELLAAEDPKDIYHAVVSSSFDADRLDYIRRDKLMTGTGAGAIDFDWLMDNVRVGEIDIGAPDSEDETIKKVDTFCLSLKALPAAEQFLLARYTLHQQVYFHKTTRCVEHMISKLLRRVAFHAGAGKAIEKNTGLKKDHILIRFFAKNGESISNYLELDDVVITGALASMTKAEDQTISDLSKRLLNRDLYKTLDTAFFGKDEGTQRQHKRRIETNFRGKINDESVILDDKASIGIYAEIGGDDDRAHKKLHVLNGKKPVEISLLSKMIPALERKEQFTRFYFENETDRDLAKTQKA